MLSRRQRRASAVGHPRVLDRERGPAGYIFIFEFPALPKFKYSWRETRKFKSCPRFTLSLVSLPERGVRGAVHANLKVSGGGRFLAPCQDLKFEFWREISNDAQACASSDDVVEPADADILHVSLVHSAPRLGQGEQRPCARPARLEEQVFSCQTRESWMS